MSEPKVDPYLSQVRRLGGLEFTPGTPEAWAELAKTLKRESRSLEHAGRIVGRFTAAGAPKHCPTPGELATVARSVPSDASLDNPTLPSACEECEPLQGLYRLIRRGDAEGVGRCRCPRGLALAALDASRGKQ
jgi:hypothetical protein